MHHAISDYSTGTAEPHVPPYPVAVTRDSLECQTNGLLVVHCLLSAWINAIAKPLFCQWSIHVHSPDASLQFHRRAW